MMMMNDSFNGGEHPEKTTKSNKDKLSHMRPVPSPRIEPGLHQCEAHAVIQEVLRPLGLATP